MAHPHLAATLARFEARVHRTKNRIVAIPAEVQRSLRLVRQPENDIVLVSIRKGRSGRWNHHYVKLTRANEFAIPADVVNVAAGEELDVKIHAVYSGVPRVPGRSTAGGAELLLELAAEERPGWRSDGSLRLDEHLAEEIDGDAGLR